MRKTGKQILPVMILGAVLFAGGCFHRGPVYSADEEQALTDAGREEAENWIRRYWEKGEVRSIEPYVFMYGSGPHYLTDYAEGVLFDGERERAFTINTKTGEMFIEPDDEAWEEFQTCARKLYLESLSLPLELEVSDFSAYVIAGTASPGGAGSWADSVVPATGLPGELVAENGDVEAYVADLDRGKTICVSGSITAPEDRELSGYTVSDRSRRGAEYGLSYDNFTLRNRFEKVFPWDYEHWEFRQWEGRRVLFRDLYRREETDRNGEIHTTVKTPELEKRASFDKTDRGWRIDMDDTDGMIELYLYVEDGDELLLYDYNYVAGETVRPLRWQKEEDGWCLARDNGKLLMLFQSAELVIRGPAEIEAAASTEDSTEAEILLENSNGDGEAYSFTCDGETFSAIYTPDNWRVIDSWRLTEEADITAVCRALAGEHPIHGADGSSFRTPEDMAYEWMQHNLAYQLLPEDNPWRENAKDVDLDPKDQGKTLEQMYEERTGKEFDLQEILEGQ